MVSDMELMGKCLFDICNASKESHEAKIAEYSEQKIPFHKLTFVLEWKCITDQFGLRAGDEACLAVLSALDYYFGEVFYIEYGRFEVLIPEPEDYQKRLKEFQDSISQWHGFLVPHVDVATEYTFVAF